MDNGTVQIAAEVILALLVIGGLVRALKAGQLNEWIKPKWRPVVALVLGAVYTAVEAWGVGREPREAVLMGALALLGAVWGHDFVINGLRNGRELGRKL